MKQRDIWLINLELTIETEIKRTRPCIILYGGAFKMITRRQGGSDAGILFGMSRKLTTKPTQFAFECDFVLNDDSMGILPLKIIAPIADFKEKYDEVPCMVKLCLIIQTTLIKYL